MSSTSAGEQSSVERPQLYGVVDAGARAAVTNPDQFSVSTVFSATNQVVNGHRSNQNNIRWTAWATWTTARTEA